MILKLKSFIYRFSNIFGLRIFLAQKEEDQYIKSLGKQSKLNKNISIGMWQAQHGFTTVLTYKMRFDKAILAKLKHAFNIR